MLRSTPAARWRLILAALISGAAIGATTFVVVPSSSEAAPGKNCTYYDSSYTTVVGQYGKDCCNNMIAWGQKTRYAACSDACLLCTPPPRN
jgi:hypothetical protein